MLRLVFILNLTNLLEFGFGYLVFVRFVLYLFFCMVCGDTLCFVLRITTRLVLPGWKLDRHVLVEFFVPPTDWRDIWL